METDQSPSNVALVNARSMSGSQTGSFVGAQERVAEQPLALNAGAFGGLRSDAANVQPDAVFTEQAKIASSSFIGGLDTKGEIPGTEHPQLTIKSVVAGVAAGGFGSICAIYYGLKTGITPSLNIISSLLGFVFVKGFMNMTGSTGIFTVQENAVIQTTAVAVIAVASSTGFSSGLLAMSLNAQTALGDGIPGNYPPEGWDGQAFALELTWFKTVAFCFSVAFFGFFIAFPLRDYCILQRKLTFPSGTATAAVIATMHANGEEAIANFWVLLKATGISSVTSMFVWGFDGLGDMPIFGIPLGNYGFTIDWDLGTFAIGLLLSPMINFSILLGGIIGSGIMRPFLDDHHKCMAGAEGEQPLEQAGRVCWYYDPNDLTGKGGSPHYLDGSAYTLFPAIAMVVVDAFYSIFKLSLVVIQGFMKTQDEDEDDEEQTDEGRARAQKLIEIFRSYKIPLPFHAAGYLICATVCVIVVTLVYEVIWWQIIVAICFTPVFAIGIIVGIGMTDWDVSASFGKLMMLPFGAMNHGSSPIAACAVCMITISGCGAAGNLMQDFKTGYLVGANPKAMFFSQMIGATAGCIIAPTTFALFNSAFTLPVNQPSAQIVTGKFGIIYRTLACVCTANGISALPTNCTTFMLVFAAIALVMNLVTDFLRSRAPRVAAYVPNPMAMSIGLLIGPSPGIEFMVGSTIFEIWRMRDKVSADKLGNIIASGFLAGSVIAVLIQIALSLGNVQNPMHLTYSDNMGHTYR